MLVKISSDSEGLEQVEELLQTSIDKWNEPVSVDWNGQYVVLEFAELFITLLPNGTWSAEKRPKPWQC